jgi:hypothetical protein
MRSDELDLARYPTDKVPNGYLKRYDPVFAPYVEREICLLELGVFEGGSLLLWRDYFPKATIVGIDVQLPSRVRGEARIHAFAGRQDDTAFLSEVARKTAPEGFDIIIDDASHIGAVTRDSFWHLFDHHLKPGGLYAIEDWGTGYLEDWPDGRAYAPRPPLPIGPRAKRRWPTHAHGMVGFIKDLVDEQGANARLRGKLSSPPGRPSKFHSMLVTPAIVFITKRDPQPEI